jgi:hypothetical protein
VTTPSPDPTPAGGEHASGSDEPAATDEPTTSPSASGDDSQIASAGAHRPGAGPGAGGGWTGPGGGGAIVGSAPASIDEPSHGDVLSSSSGLRSQPAGHGGPGDLLGAFFGSVAERVAPTVQPAAVAAVASAFGFPLVLMLAVVLFLVIQSRLDSRDPKLRAAPLTAADTYLPFADGDHR